MTDQTMSEDTGLPRLAPAWLKRGAWRGWISFLVVLALWQAACRYHWIDPTFLPTPEAVALRGWTEVTKGTILFDLAESLRRNMTGLMIGAGAGLMLGLLLGTSETASRFIGPTLLAQRQTCRRRLGTIAQTLNSSACATRSWDCSVSTWPCRDTSRRCSRYLYVTG